MMFLSKLIMCKCIQYIVFVYLVYDIICIILRNLNLVKYTLFLLHNVYVKYYLMYTIYFIKWGITI